MLEMGTSGLMSGAGKRGGATASALAPGLDSTGRFEGQFLTVLNVIDSAKPLGRRIGGAVFRERVWLWGVIGWFGRPLRACVEQANALIRARRGFSKKTGFCKCSVNSDV